MCQKMSYVTAYSDPDLHRIRFCADLYCNQVMFSVSNALRVVVYTLVRCASEQRPTQGTYTQQMFDCLWIHLHA